MEDRLNTLEKSAVYERTILEGLSPPGEDQLMIDDDLENGVRLIVCVVIDILMYKILLTNII